MDKKESKAEQSSTHPKGVSVRTKVKMVQNVLLIWLDSNIDESTSDCRNTITQLRRVVHTINTFTDGKQCIAFLADTYEERVCMVISGVLGQQIVPSVHDMPQVNSIFIFCDNNQYHEQWSKDWSKIKGVFSEVEVICDVLKQAAQQCERNATSISIIGSVDDVSKQNLDQLDPSFMYTQIMKEILLTITFEQQHIDEFIQHFREVLAGNEGQLKHVDQFERTYRKQTPIWWYTYDCFLYPMLNRALRLMDADLIIKLGFFIGDLHLQIQQLHQEQFGNQNSKNHFTVYRGQGMAKDEFQKMAATQSGLLSFNCFLSTSKDDEVSLSFAESSSMNPDMVGVLFVMKIDPARSSTPFASIGDVGCYGDQEGEVLFSMHTVFRIGNITPMDANGRLFRVELTLTSDDDNDLCQLTDRIREETFPDSRGWYRLGNVLSKMGQPAKAQQVYEILLEQEVEETCKAPIYNQLGLMKQDLGEYPEAIAYHENSIKIEEKQIPPNDQNLASSYNNIGVVYYSMGDYPKAFSSYEKALAIQQQSFAPNHPHLASSYNNIGMVYHSMGDYLEALSSYEKAFAIRQQSLPPNHPDLASSHNNIGLVYDHMSDYPKALLCYEKALAIQEESLPPKHPNLADSYICFGSVYESMGDYPKALTSYEKALAIQQQSLPPNHPDLAGSYNNIGTVYRNMDDYPKALSSYKNALTIRQQSLPSNHSDLASSYNNIGMVYYSMGNYPKALSFYEKALAIRQNSLPSNHPDVAGSYNNIGIVYRNMDDYPKALLFHEKAFAILQQSLPPNHPRLAMSHFNMGLLNENMGNYSEAYSSYERAVDIGQRSLPLNHPDLKDYQNKLADLKKQL